MSATRTWWCAYDDGTVWPCEVLNTGIFGTTVRALYPAPDAGEVRTVDQRAVYDGNFKRPGPGDYAGERA